VTGRARLLFTAIWVPGVILVLLVDDLALRLLGLALMLAGLAVQIVGSRDPDGP
jgi:hypothetical protein